MKSFNPLDYVCPVCDAPVNQWCDPLWEDGSRMPYTGFTHEQRTTYNLLANQPADGITASDEQIRDAVLKSGRI